MAKQALKEIQSKMNKFESHQEIKELTHMLDNSLSCIDLIFMSQPRLIIESEAHSFFYLDCQHHIIFSKFNLEIIYLPL